MTRARARRTGAAQLVLMAVALFSGGLTYSSFSSNTTGTANRFAAGTVSLDDNDAESTMLELSGAQPGAVDTGCIRVVYAGTLPARVRLHATTTGSMAAYLTLTVTRGVDSDPSFDSCEGFVADATNYVGSGPGVVYNGTLAAFPAGWTEGLVDPPSGEPEAWTTNEAHSYQLSVTLVSDAAAQGTSASTEFVWEARNL